ncbi:MAG: hypothetical protein J6P28_03180 [Treponema sp.]|nr:hypothetical protein [Treponema sp.]
MKFAGIIGKEEGNFFIPVGSEQKALMIRIKCTKCGDERNIVSIKNRKHIRYLKRFECVNCKSKGFLVEV